MDPEVLATVGSEQDVAARDVGRDIGRTRLGERLTQSGHRDEVVATHVDAAQQRDVRPAHQPRRSPMSRLAGLASDLAEAEVLVEADGVVVGRVHAQVDAGDPALAEVREQPLDEGCVPAPALVPGPSGRCGGAPGSAPSARAGSARAHGSSPIERGVLRAVVDARIARAQRRPPRRLGPCLEVERVVGRQQVAGHAVVVDERRAGCRCHAPCTAPT